MIRLDATSFVPPYEQIRSQLATQIANHALPAGTRLPTVRSLADELGVAVNTVARAYRELETAGLVSTRGRGGTVVSAAGDAARAELGDAAQRFVERARALGISDAEALRLVRAAQGAAPPTGA